MFTGEPIRHIRYCFDKRDSFDGLSDIELHAQEYIEKCYIRLQEEYPDADIDIDGSSTRPIQVNGRDDTLETENVHNICNETLQDYIDNIIPTTSKRMLDIIEASQEYDVPVMVLRWACVEGLITSAEKRGSRWICGEKGIRDFVKEYIRGGPEGNVWKVDIHKEKAILQIPNAEEILDQPCEDFEQGLDILVTHDSINYEGVELPGDFTKESSYLAINVNREDLSITSWLFEDVTKWEPAHNITFKKFGEMFIEEAKRLVDQIFKSEFTDSDKECLFITSILKFSNSTTLRNEIEKHLRILCSIADNTELIASGGPIWKESYEKNEKLFRDEILDKLLRKMSFEEIDQCHGPNEYGKDFTFTERTRFGIPRYYGLQAKKGSLTGGDARADRIAIDEILRQLDDAFTIPYRSKNTSEPRFISVFIIAISGVCSHQAREKMWWKLMKQGRIGSVYIWDRNTILELIRQFWLNEKPIALDWILKSDLLADSR